MLTDVFLILGAVLTARAFEAHPHFPAESLQLNPKFPVILDQVLLRTVQQDTLFVLIR